LTGGDLASTSVLPRLATQRLGSAYRFLPTCVSTNDEVSSRAAEGEAEGLLIATDEQTGGRGRRGRTWHSPPGENLTFSLLLRPALPARRTAPLTLLAGAALARALTALGFSPRLKWPNDVLLESAGRLRKVAGILAETASEGDHVRHLVLGVGVNVNGRDFPSDLAERATSLCLLCGEAIDRGAVLAAFVNAFEPIYDDFLAQGPGPGLDEWHRYAQLGQHCWVQHGDSRIEGIALRTDESGALVLRTAEGNTFAVHAGEVNWIDQEMR
jgi:BirA family transcriptional regulator, biotin operon repressor / biotin---[acetyl-CoA-carboxylase] ligase